MNTDKCLLSRNVDKVHNDIQGEENSFPNRKNLTEMVTLFARIVHKVSWSACFERTDPSVELISGRLFTCLQEIKHIHHFQVDEWQTHCSYLDH
jgi:hypothetical protein